MNTLSFLTVALFMIVLGMLVMDRKPVPILKLEEKIDSNNREIILIDHINEAFVPNNSENGFKHRNLVICNESKDLENGHYTYPCLIKYERRVVAVEENGDDAKYIIEEGSENTGGEYETIYEHKFVIYGDALPIPKDSLMNKIKKLILTSQEHHTGQSGEGNWII